MTDEAQIADEVVNGTNKNNVYCQFCHSLILKNKMGDYVEQQCDLPLMQQKNTKNATAVETEALHHFWVIRDMFTFENIGFSNTVDNRKYLTCADCDMGPVGYVESGNEKCYIALKRVRHRPCAPSAGTSVDESVTGAGVETSCQVSF